MLKAVICSERLPSGAVKELRKIAERVFLLPEDNMLSEPVCHHPDMILTVLGDKMICHREYFEKNRKALSSMCGLSGLTPVLSDAERGSKYPHDIAFNVLVTDKYIYCNEKYTAKEVLSCAAEFGLGVVNTAQGYAACSCLYAENTIITADFSVACASKGKNDVLLCESGGIILEPYDTGFIGGACGYIDGVLYTLGDLKYYNGSKAVTDFAKEKNITVVPLLEGELRDFGGIKFIR